ncbi:MAG: hypothetical protein H6868_08780 [Rhodospirillales bacterium]|nr:hypothetical protein [Rhodospirillales bacterium]
MAITPINPGTPVAGTGKTDKPQGAREEKNIKSSATQDVVEISVAARQKFEESQKLSESQAKKTAEKTREQLAENDEATLAPEGSFSDL